MTGSLQWLVKKARRSPMPVLATTFVIALICWGGAWLLQDMTYLPAILLSFGCAAVVLLIGVSVYVLVAKVERNN